MLVNIGIFTDTYFPQVSGVATSIDTLRSQLEQKGHTVYIFTTTDPDVEKMSMSAMYFALLAFRLFLLPIDASLLEGCFSLIK